MDFIIPVADKVLSYAEYTELCGGVDMQKIELTLPKFKYEPEYKSMHETLFALGVPAKPYFFSRLGMAEEMAISQVIHKMYINVNEDGAEAAAVTGSGMCTSTGPGEDIPEYKIVEFNRPFYFVVREVEHDIVMVIGHVANL